MPLGRIAKLPGTQKDALLNSIAKRLKENTPAILVANEIDLSNGRAQGLDPSMLDRLMLSPERIQAIAQAVKEIAAQEDPVGTMNKIQRMPSGIQVGKMRIPIGVIAMIYESAP